MKYLITEVILALNSLKKVPGFLVTVLLTLGGSLGALTCMLALNYLLFIKPLEYKDPERLFLIKGVLQNNGVTMMENVNSYASAGAFSDMTEVLDDSATLSFETMELSSHTQQPLVTASFVSPTYFDMLNIPMHLGRRFDTTERTGNYNPNVVLSYTSWSNLFNSDENIIGSKITLGDRSFTVVGVADPTFTEPKFFSAEFSGSDIWLPWDYHRGGEQARKNWTALSPTINAIGLVKSNYSEEQAEQLISAQINEVFTKSVAPPGAQIPYAMRAKLSNVDTVVSGDSRSSSILLLSGAAILLLIAVGNVVNLMLSRTAQLHRQLTIRATLGANMGHIFKSMMAENSMIMLMVLAIAIGTAQLGFVLLHTLASKNLPRLNELSLNMEVFLLTAVICVALALFFSFVSSRLIQYRKLQQSLQSSGKGSGLQISPSVRGALVACQVALGAMLVVANVSVLQESNKIITQEMGFEPQDLHFVSVNYKGQADTPKKDLLAAQITEALSNHPGIDMVAAASSELTRPRNGGTATRSLGDPAAVNVMMFYSGANFFNASQQQMVSGRNFTVEEVRQRANVAVVTQSLAKAVYPDGSAIGKRIFHNNSQSPYEIVGITADLNLPPQATALGGESMSLNHLYMPALSLSTNDELRFFIKAQQGVAVTKSEIQNLLTQLDKQLQVWDIVAIETRQAELLARETATAKSTVALSLLALFLVGIGVYGVVNYSTQLRRYELGVRMAIGASPVHIIRKVLLDSIKPVILGLVFALVGGFMITGGMQQQIAQYINVNAIDVIVTATTLIITVIIACLIPISKVARHWPVHALRT